MTDPKPKIVPIRFSVAELSAIDAAVAAEGLDRSKVVRRAVRMQLGQPVYDPEELEQLRASWRELNAIGRNLMMAVRHMNRLAKGGEIVHPSDHLSAETLTALHREVAAHGKLIARYARSKTGPKGGSS